LFSQDEKYTLLDFEKLLMIIILSFVYLLYSRTCSFYSDLTDKQVDLSSTRSLHSYKKDEKTCENEENGNNSASLIEKLRLKRLARRSQHCEQLESDRNLNPTPTEEKTQLR
jgi:hypothetical protein